MSFLKSGSGVKLKPDFDKINKAIVMIIILAIAKGYQWRLVQLRSIAEINESEWGGRCGNFRDSEDHFISVLKRIRVYTSDFVQDFSESQEVQKSTIILVIINYRNSRLCSDLIMQKILKNLWLNLIYFALASILSSTEKTISRW